MERISAAHAKTLLVKLKRPRFAVAPKEQRTVDGVVFASKKEATRYRELQLLELAGLIRKLTLQPRFPVFIDGQAFCVYRADFSYDKHIALSCWEKVIEEVKSSGTAKDSAYRLRRKAAELYFGITVTEVIR